MIHNHLYVYINNRKTKLSAIPNFEFGSFGDGGATKILLFLPNSAKSNFIANDVFEILYNHVARPALIEACKSQGNRLALDTLPLSFQQHQNKCNLSGKFNFLGIRLSKSIFDQFIPIFEQKMATFELFQSYFWAVYVKGLKFPLQCLGDVNLNIDDSIISMFMRIGLQYPNDTYFDIARTVYDCSDDEESSSVFLKEDAIDRFLSKFDLTNQQEDLYCLIPSLKFIRGEVKSRNLNSHVVYCQIYTTDKVPLFCGLQNQSASLLDPQDILSNGPKFRSMRKILKETWPGILSCNFGLRLEFRITFTHFRHITENNDLSLFQVFTPDDFIKIPTCHVTFYKMFLASCYLNMIDCLHLSNLCGFRHGSNEYRTIVLTSVLLKGLISRLQDESWNREIYAALDIRDQLKMFNRFCVKTENYDSNKKIFIFQEENLKVDKLFFRESSSSKRKNQSSDIGSFIKNQSITKTAHMIVSQYKSEVWTHISMWTAIQGPNCKITSDCFDKHFTRKILETVDIAALFVFPNRCWNEIIRDLFNFEGRILTGKHMQNWASLEYIKIFQRVKMGLNIAETQELESEIMNAFASTEVIIPGFELNGKFFHAKRLGQGRAMIFFAR